MYDPVELAATFHSKSTQWLINRISSGTLDVLPNEIAVKELKARGVEVPQVKKFTFLSVVLALVLLAIPVWGPFLVYFASCQPPEAVLLLQYIIFTLISCFPIFTSIRRALPVKVVLLVLYGIASPLLTAFSMYFAYCVACHVCH